MIPRKQLVTLSVALCLSVTAAGTNIMFADSNVKALCVQHWDSDGDGELSTEEAAGVTTLGTVFRENRDIATFEELSYFTGLTSINDHAFYKSSIQKVSFPESVTEIGEYAFSESDISGELRIPGTVKAIRNYAFDNCKMLTGAILEEGVERFGYLSFTGPISTLSLPSTLAFISSMAVDPYENAYPGMGMFVPVGDLYVYVHSTVPPAINYYAFYYVFGGGHLIVPTGAVKAYKASDAWSQFGEYIEFGDVNEDGIVNDLDLSAIEDYISSGESDFNPLLSDVNFDGVTDEKDVEYLNRYFEKLASLIKFADSNVKSLCVQNWDSDGDGELSIEEAASVTTLGTVFYENRDIVTFEELSYFTGLTSINDHAFYKSSIQKVSFPESVTEIGEYAFSESDISGELRIPGTVKAIRDNAFEDCKMLTNVVLEEGVEQFGNLSFTGPISTLSLPSTLTFISSMGINPYGNVDPGSGVIVPDGDLWVYAHANTPADIHENAFYYVFREAHLVVPLGSLDAYKSHVSWKLFGEYFEFGDVNLDGIVNYLDLSAIEDYISSGESDFDPLLSDVNFDGVTDEKDVEYIKNHIRSSANVITFADSNVKSLCVQNWDIDGDGELSFEEAASVTTLGTVFYENGDIVTFEELRYFTGLTSINDYAFYKSSIQKVSFPESVTEIGEYAFSHSDISGELRIPGTVKVIRNKAFEDCKQLTGVVLEEGVETVGQHSLSGPIRTLSLPSTLTFMSSMAVNVDPTSGTLPDGGLWVYAHANTPADINENAFYYVFDETHLVVPLGSMDAYKSHGSWKLFGEYFEFGDVNLDGIVNYLDLSAIEDYISSGESDFDPLLSDVNFDGVTDEKDVEYIKNHIRSSANVITFADSNVKSLCVQNWDIDGDGELSFEEAASVTTLGTVFYENGDIVTFEELRYFTGLTSINDYAFYKSSIQKVSFPETVTEIGEYAFSESDISGELRIPGTVKAIRNNAFDGCKQLTGVVLEEGVETVGQHSLSGPIRTLSLPSTLTFMSSMAVNVDPTSGTLPDGGLWVYAHANTPADINENAFYYVFDETHLVVPLGSMDAYKSHGSWKLFGEYFEFGDVNLDGIVNYLDLSAIEDYISSGESEFDPLLSDVNFDGVTDEEDVEYIKNHIRSSANVITFADSNVKALCVQNWDSDGDGELSIEEAASVTTLGTVFRENRDIVTFEELSYFTGLTSINDHAFYKSSIQKVSFPESVTEIGEYAFSHSDISGELRIPGTVKAIRNNAFDGCKQLTGVVLEEGVETVGQHSLSGPIRTLSLPSTLTFMSSMAVNVDPTSGTLPDGGLWVYAHANTPADINENAFYYVFDETHLVVPLGSMDAYKSHGSWKLFGEYFEFGDVNLDGIVNDMDLSAIKDYISSGEPEFNPLLSDVNFDGVTDEKDVEYIKNHIGITTSVNSIDITPIDTRIYTIDGRRLPDNVTVSSLPHGIYILNGRKFIVE